MEDFFHETTCLPFQGNALERWREVCEGTGIALYQRGECGQENHTNSNQQEERKIPRFQHSTILANETHHYLLRRDPWARDTLVGDLTVIYPPHLAKQRACQGPLTLVAVRLRAIVAPK